MKNNENSIINILIIILNWKRFIIINFFIVIIIAIIFSLIMPKTYSASTVILPPGEESGFLSNLAADIPIEGITGLFGGGSQQLNTIIAILNSRTLATRTIKKFNLSSRYKSENIEEAIFTFREKVSINLEREGTIKITANATTDYFEGEHDELQARKLCADIANYMSAELNRLNIKLETEQARQQRIFIEKRYDRNKLDLRQAEINFRNFSKKYGIFSLPEQISAAVNAAADLESQISVKDIQLEILKRSARQNYGKINQLKIEIESLKKKLSQFKYGKYANDSLQIIPGFHDAPELAMKYYDLQREIEVQNSIYKFLTQQYEQSKLQEAKDVPTIQILDKAVAPIKRTKPKRKMLVLLSGMAAIFLSLIYIVTIEHFRNIKKIDPENYERLQSLINEVNLFKKKSK